MPKIVWADEYVCYLIDNVYQVKHVWDSKNPRYKNKSLKRQFWYRLVKEMNRVFTPNIRFTNNEVVRKWNNLKSYYALEAQKDGTTKRCSPSDESTDNIKSVWKYKTRLDFLSDVRKRTQIEKKYKRSYSAEDSSEKSFTPPFNGSVAQNEIIKTETYSEISFPMSPGSCENENFDNDIHDNGTTNEDITRKTECFSDLTEAITENIKVDTSIASANSTFGSCILAEIDKLDPDLQLMAKRQLFSVIMDLQGEQLRRSQK